jgi:hypothetical protein
MKCPFCNIEINDLHSGDRRYHIKQFHFIELDKIITKLFYDYNKAVSTE